MNSLSVITNSNDGRLTNRLLCGVALLFALFVVMGTAQAETIQRIGYSTVWFAADKHSTNAELFLTKAVGSTDQTAPIFWVKVSQTVVSSGSVVSETVSIKEFPTVQYREVLRELQLVSNFDDPTVYRKLFLCDSPGYRISLGAKTQNVVDVCGTDPGGLPRVESHMLKAGRLVEILVRKTIRNPNATYRRR